MTQRLLLLLVCCLVSWTISAQLSTVTSVNLEFEANDGAKVTATASDSGSGLAVDGSISLIESTGYTLSITLFNGTNDITSEVMTNANQLQFFFETSEGLLADGPSYNDMDANMLPLGLSSSLTGNCVFDSDLSGSFRIALNDLGDQKSVSSSISDGSAIFDLSWSITITDDINAPECENEEEAIDKVTLTFTPTAGGDAIVAVATDPDGPGPMDLVAGDIILDESTEYEMSITVENTAEGENITEEIAEEDGEHLFFFSFAEGLFESPDGNGNIDKRDDPINYNDMDDNGLPVGLSTNWTTACTGEGDVVDTFRVVLKHQPDIKSATSTAQDGGTDINILWNVTVVDDAEAPECENEEEAIDKVTLTFTAVDGSDVVVSEAIDPDGPGPMSIVPLDITLEENTEYELSIKVENTAEGEDITEEISEEDEEHQFYFAWTGDIFSQPMGDGNIDNRDDPVNYNDMDDNGLPVGLSTNWTTNVSMSSGTLNIVLKHQPDFKSTTSTAQDGGTDIDLTWNINSVVTSTNNLRPDQRLTVAPNPVQDNLYFLTENVDLSQSTMIIFNSVGAQIRTLRNPSNEINISNLAPGLYTVQIRGEQLRWNGRFVKTNN